MVSKRSLSSPTPMQTGRKKRTKLKPFKKNSSTWDYPLTKLSLQVHRKLLNMNLVFQGRLYLICSECPICLSSPPYQRIALSSFWRQDFPEIFASSTRIFFQCVHNLVILLIILNSPPSQKKSNTKTRKDTTKTSRK